MNYLALFIKLEGVGGSTTQSPWTLIIYLVAIVALMYFLIIRPQKKKQKQEEQMRNSIHVGDEVLTIGGIFGKIIAIKEDSYIVESGPDRAKMRVSKWSIQQNLTVHENEEETAKTKKK